MTIIPSTELAESPSKIPWYFHPTNAETLRQGEILFDVVLTKPAEHLDAEAVNKIGTYKSNIIVLTQSCDLEHKKLRRILVAEIDYFKCYMLQLKTNESITKKRIQAEHKDLQAGRIHNLHMLSHDEAVGLTDDVVVNFHGLNIIDLNSALNCHKRQDKRIALNSPYLEHLSQAFARFFMRVGLPSNILPIQDVRVNDVLNALDSGK